jgi:hypothetical protein
LLSFLLLSTWLKSSFEPLTPAQPGRTATSSRSLTPNDETASDVTRILNSPRPILKTTASEHPSGHPHPADIAVALQPGPAKFRACQRHLTPPASGRSGVRAKATIGPLWVTDIHRLSIVVPPCLCGYLHGK